MGHVRVRQRQATAVQARNDARQFRVQVLGRRVRLELATKGGRVRGAVAHKVLVDVRVAGCQPPSPRQVAVHRRPNLALVDRLGPRKPKPGPAQPHRRCGKLGRAPCPRLHLVVEIAGPVRDHVRGDSRRPQHHAQNVLQVADGAHKRPLPPAHGDAHVIPDVERHAVFGRHRKRMRHQQLQVRVGEQVPPVGQRHERRKRRVDRLSGPCKCIHGLDTNTFTHTQMSCARGVVGNRETYIGKGGAAPVLHRNP